MPKRRIHPFSLLAKFTQRILHYPIEEIEKNIPIDKLIEKFPEITHPAGDEGNGVLSAKYIETCAQKYKLIYPFEKSNLKGASYILDVGDEYAVQGESNKLIGETGKNEIKIYPFQVAIIKTRQIINMPRFLIGRWNIKVSRAYEGLLWVGGPQVDPGWVGHLYCPVYNLSSKTIILRLGEDLATIDFVRADAYDEAFKKQYIKRPPKRTKLEHYKPVLQSALYTEAAKRIDKIEERANRLEGLILGPILTSIAIMVALIGLLLVNLKNILPEMLPVLSLALSVGFFIAAIAVMIIYKRKSEAQKEFNKKIALLFLLIGLMLGSIGSLFLHYMYSKEIKRDLETISTLTQKSNGSKEEKPSQELKTQGQTKGKPN